MSSILDNSIRIKITGKCNRSCFFCHKEGCMDIDDLIFTDELQRIIQFLSKNLNIHNIAVTGGEPLLHPSFNDLIGKFIGCDGIEHVSLTTNGTISKGEAFWEALKEKNVYKVNISIPDILEGPIKNISPHLNSNIFRDQIELIKILNRLNIDVNINIAIINDFLYTSSIINRLNELDDLKFKIMLLPNLTNSETFSYSQNVINLVCESLGLSEKEVYKKAGTSSSIIEYTNDCNRTLYVKTTKSHNMTHHIRSLCENCNTKNNCQEGFYGIRLEQINKKYYIRLCLHKSTPDCVMLFDDFINSNVYKELHCIWN